MSCYFFVQVDCSDAQKRSIYDEYIEHVKPIVESYGGTYVIRTEHIVSLDSWHPDRVILIRFANREQLDTCFHSPEYLSICEKRTSSVESHALILEGIQDENL